VSVRTSSVEHYDRDAPTFGARYSSARFEDVHEDLLPFLPPPGSKVLDIGAGSGRDAAALVELGYLVTAAEPSLKMQVWGRGLYGANGVEWVEDQLPALSSLRAVGQQYDFILC